MPCVAVSNIAVALLVCSQLSSEQTCSSSQGCVWTPPSVATRPPPPSSLLSPPPPSSLFPPFPPSSCPSGRATALELTHASTYFLQRFSMLKIESVISSSPCSTPVTPGIDTFFIWSFILFHLSFYPVPGSFSEEEAWHVVGAFESTTSWMEASIDGRVVASSSFLVSAICHTSKMATLACRDGRSFLCCAASQFHTWLEVERILLQAGVDAYGPECSLSSRAVDPVESFSRRFGAAVDAVSERRGGDVHTSLQTFSWALRGVCRALESGCPSISSNSSNYAIVLHNSRAPALSAGSSMLCSPSWP